MAKSLYKLLGAYHWDWYANNHKKTYVRHVDFLKRWVREKNTIDIGAGDGVITHKLSIRGVDDDPTAIKLAAEKGVKIDYGDAYRLPYEKEQFDSAIMSDLLEHLWRMDRPLSEARRVIKKYLYVSLPLRERFMESGYYHNYTPQELVEKIEKKGFKLVEGPRKKIDRLHYYLKFEKVA